MCFSNSLNVHIIFGLYCIENCKHIIHHNFILSTEIITSSTKTIQTSLSADDDVTSEIPATTEQNKIYHHLKTSADDRSTGFSEAGYLRTQKFSFYVVLAAGGMVICLGIPLTVFLFIKQRQLSQLLKRQVKEMKDQQAFSKFI